MTVAHPVAQGESTVAHAVCVSPPYPLLLQQQHQQVLHSSRWCGSFRGFVFEDAPLCRPANRRQQSQQRGASPAAQSDWQPSCRLASRRYQQFRRTSNHCGACSEMALSREVSMMAR
jgi:hypothetical protein